MCHRRRDTWVGGMEDVSHAGFRRRIANIVIRELEHSKCAIDMGPNPEDVAQTFYNVRLDPEKSRHLDFQKTF